MPPAAKKGDQIVAIDMHQIISGGATSPVPHPFSGIIDGGLSSDVTIEGKAAATRTSTATNTPSHVPIGGSFANPPNNKGQITKGSASVTINGKPAARLGDPADTCTDQPPLLRGSVVAVSTVRIGG